VNKFKYAVGGFADGVEAVKPYVFAIRSSAITTHQQKIGFVVALSVVRQFAQSYNLSITTCKRGPLAKTNSMYRQGIDTPGT